MQASTYFPKVRRMLLFHSPLMLTHFGTASKLLHGHLALATLSLPETDPQFLEHWSYADEVLLDKSFRAKDFGLEYLRDVQRLSWILHIGSVSVCLSSSVKSMKSSAAPYPGIRNKIVVYSSIWPLHFCHHSFETFCQAVTYLPICILFLSCRTSTPEDAMFHRMEWCKFLWGNLCTAVELISNLGFCL